VAHDAYFFAGFLVGLEFCCGTDSVSIVDNTAIIILANNPARKHRVLSA